MPPPRCRRFADAMSLRWLRIRAIDMLLLQGAATG